jgi:hypothetical protein
MQWVMQQRLQQAQTQRRREAVSQRKKRVLLLPQIVIAKRNPSS